MTRDCPNHRAAFSLVEMLVVVAVIGILATLAIPNIGKVTEGSKRSIAKNLIETLNQAGRQFGHSQYDLRTASIPTTAADDLLVLRTLQWRDPNPSGELNAPGPFMRNDWNPALSTDSQDYRAEWTGSSWRLLEPGTPGAGLKIVFDGSDLGTPYIHSPDFSPVGSR